MAEIDHLDRIDAINLAKKMRNKVRNLEIDRTAASKGVMRTVASTGSAYVLGRFMGGLEVEYRQNQAAIDAGQADDPRKIAGMDLDGVIGGVTVALGLIGVAKGKGKLSQPAELVLAAGDGMLSGYAYQLGMKQGMEAAETA